MENRELEMARRIAAEVDMAGGRTFFVGGYVRDLLLGLDNKDIDIEVHGVSVETLEGILDGLGERLTMGASFGVMGLRHYGLDIAMPRSERATGRGHRDFAVSVDPFLGLEKAARRRDFTMNAMMLDVLTDELLDFFGGREDLKNRRIRHVNDESFAEDPLRVLRAAQFAARFGFSVADSTRRLAAETDASALPPERVMGELRKALLKSETPSVFFQELSRMDQLSFWFSELEPLEEKSMRSLDIAAKKRDLASEPLRFMLAALCAGLEPSSAEGLLTRLTSQTRLIGYVMNMAENRNAPEALLRSDAPETAYMRLFDRSVRPEDLLLLTGTENALGPMLSLYRERMAAPGVMGRDLLEAGISPGPMLGEALEYARGLRLAGASRQEQLRRALRHIRNNEKTGDTP